MASHDVFLAISYLQGPVGGVPDGARVRPAGGGGGGGGGGVVVQEHERAAGYGCVRLHGRCVRGHQPGWTVFRRGGGASQVNGSALVQ